MSLVLAGQLRSATLPGFDQPRWQSHALHRTERVWAETNCYVDLWIELLHGLGLEPLAGCAFAISSGFEGDQWTFFKPPPEDLRQLFGLVVSEMNVWRPITEHLAEQITLGRALTIEVDAFFLPDTAGVSYHLNHGKTTLAPVSVDLDRRWMSYLHGGGRYELDGPDFDGVLRRADTSGTELPPYVEIIKLDELRRRDIADLQKTSTGLLRKHLKMRPRVNPVRQLGQRVAADLPWLLAGDDQDFHAYAFGVCRQCGASAEIAAAFLDWLNDPSGAAEDWRDLAVGAKSLQFALARAARGKAVDVEGIFNEMAAAYDRAVSVLVAHYGD